MKFRIRFAGLAAVILAASTSFAQPAGRGGPARGQSPASRRPPASAVPQSYTPEEINSGRTHFSAQCGFCHGRDAQGGEEGPDLTRSALVAEDVRGDKIEPFIRSGRVDKGMPAFTLPAADVSAIVAFIHDAKREAESQAGGRRSVEASDLQTGNAEAGKRYFTGAGGCVQCHQLSGNFATVGARFQGLALMQRMLYPRPGRGSRPVLPSATVTTVNGEKITGSLAYRDEFSVTLLDAAGWSHSWAAAKVKIEVQDPLHAHAEQLAKYTDQDMHDVLAFLETLK